MGNGHTEAVVTSGTVAAGQWYTVTAWHDAAANTLNIQLDNGAVTSVSYTYGAMDTTYPMSVGAFANGVYVLDGRVDELALYKRILTAQERTWLYNNGQGCSYADVVTNVVQYHAVLSAVTNGICPQGEICDYDQAQTGVNNTYTYDNNGNQITRTINGVTLTLNYDADGRMVSVTGQGINAAFIYDGDGARVKSIINNTTTYFVGNHYEVSGEVVTKYYYAGSSRVTMRTDDTVYYLLSDHLGSASVTTDDSGDKVSELRYSAWGGVRYSYGTTPTNYTFTAQYSNMPDFGLMFYNARWYDPAVGRFTQADSIVPGAGSSQAWDRYGYGLNNPSRYTDPSGHKACDGVGIGGKCDQAQVDDLLKFYGITASGLTEKKKWEVADAAILVNSKLSVAGYGSFRRIHGEITVTGVGLTRDNCETIVSTITCGSAAQYMTAFLHEFGHAAENHLAAIFGRLASDLDSYTDNEGHPIDDGGGYWMRTTYGFKCDNWDCLEHPPSLDVNQTDGYAKAEQWADLYMNWVLDETGDEYHGFTNDTYGNARRNYMSQQFYWLLTENTLP